MKNVKQRVFNLAIHKSAVLKSQQMILYNVCKKTAGFFVFDKKMSRTGLATFLRESNRHEFLKTRSLLIVNDCFKKQALRSIWRFLAKTK